MTNMLGTDSIKVGFEKKIWSALLNKPRKSLDALFGASSVWFGTGKSEGQSNTKGARYRVILL